MRKYDPNYILSGSLICLIGLLLLIPAITQGVAWAIVGGLFIIFMGVIMALTRD